MLKSFKFLRKNNDEHNMYLTDICKREVAWKKMFLEYLITVL